MYSSYSYVFSTYTVTLLNDTNFMYFSVRELFQGDEKKECKLKFHELLEKPQMQVYLNRHV